MLMVGPLRTMLRLWAWPSIVLPGAEGGPPLFSGALTSPMANLNALSVELPSEWRLEDGAGRSTLKRPSQPRVPARALRFGDVPERERRPLLAHWRAVSGPTMCVSTQSKRRYWLTAVDHSSTHARATEWHMALPRITFNSGGL